MFPDISIPNSKLTLKLLKQSDSSAIYNLFNLCENIVFMDIEQILSLSQAEHFVEKYFDSFINGEKVYWLIKDVDKNICVGIIGLSNINKKHHFSDLTILINREFRGNGIAKECLQYFLEYLFINTFLVRFEAQIHTDNLASIKLFEALGFEREGLLRKNFLIEGKYFDSYIYSLISSNLY